MSAKLIGGKYQEIEARDLEFAQAAITCPTGRAAWARRLGNVCDRSGWVAVTWVTPWQLQ